MKKSLGMMLGITMLAAASQAEAGDAKTYPAMMCQHTSGTPNYYRGNIYNASSSTMNVYCPFLRDNSASSSLGTVTFYAFDTNPSSNQDVSCVAFSHPVGNSNYYTGSGKSSGSNTSSVQTVTITSVAAYSGGYAYLQCSIPPTYSGYQSGMTMYMLDEPS